VAPVKFIAKIASDENKPNGQFVVLPNEVDPFLEQLPLGKIPGVGKVTLERLNLKGLYTGKDVRGKGVNWMQQHVGNFGVSLYQKCAGEYIGSVSTERIRKSLSVEHTYEYNKTSLQECLDQIPSLIDELTRRLDKQQLQNRINKLSVKVKFANFVVTSADQAYHQLNTEIFVQLLTKAYQRGLQQPVRLLGIGVGIKSQPEHNLQLSILD
jgi:DNA polymerase-4